MEHSTAKPAYLDADFDKFVTDSMEEWHVPGASLAIIDGKNIYTKGYGVMKTNGPAVDENTLFNTASMSKSFTASAVALLVQDDEKYPHVHWNTPASQLMRDDFVLSDPYRTETVTITDMLSHRTGMPRHDDVPHGLDATVPDTPRSITRKLRHLPFSKPLRTHFQYNNLMFNAASYLVECVTGEAFDDVLKTRFWDPLGMDRTYLGKVRVAKVLKQHPELEGQIAQGYTWDKKTKIYNEAPDINAPEGQGAGNIVSSAKEWAKWVSAMIHQSSALSKESLEELTKPIVYAMDDGDIMKPGQSAILYGMGWYVEYYRGYKLVSHSGGVPGFSCLMAWLPEREWGFVMFGNADDAYCTSSIVRWTLIDELLAVPRSERTDWAQAFRDQARDSEKERAENEKDLFPKRANPPLPMSLPFDDYTGQYTHPAYGDLSVGVENGQLVAYAPDRTFAYTIRWKHVSGNYFIAVKGVFPDGEEYQEKFESTFEVGASGTVERLGIDFVDEADSEYIWFDRVRKPDGK